MNEIKLNVSIELKGRTMLEKKNITKTIQTIIPTKKGKKVITKVVEDWDKMDKTVDSGRNPPVRNARNGRTC